MFVRLWMTEEPTTAAPDLPVLEALDLMHGLHFRRLPIVEDGQLLGLVTEGMLTRVPARDIANPLSKYMIEDPVCVGPYKSLDEAALLMRQHKVGGLPVVSKGKLVGILTESNVFDAVAKFMEAGTPEATQVCCDFADEPGAIARISSFTEEFGLEILSFVTHRRGADVGRRILAMRLLGAHMEEYVEALWKKGLRVLNVSQAATEEPEG